MKGDDSWVSRSSDRLSGDPDRNRPVPCATNKQRAGIEGDRLHASPLLLCILFNQRGPITTISNPVILPQYHPI